MDLGYRALMCGGTWVLVAQPSNTNIVTCKWFVTLNNHIVGTIARHKAWFVAKGFTLALGIDDIENFSPLVHIKFIRVLLSLVLNQGWSLYQLDLSNAF